MPANSNIAWGRLIAESAAIVFSILLAFAIDAWWADRQDRVEEVRILEALKAEFEDNARRLPGRIRLHQKAAESAAELLATLRPAVGSGSVRVEDALIYWVIDQGSFDPARGAFDAMLQSDGLRYIQNPTIRQALAEWPSVVVDATENEQLLRTIWGPRLLQVLSGQIDMGLIRDVEIRKCGDAASGPRCPGEPVALQPTLELIGGLEPVRGHTLEAAREFAIVEKRARELVELIEQELE